MLRFKEGFRLGVATASTQIEGGFVDSNWTNFCDEGHIKDNSHCGIATDHYNRYLEDARLLKEMGIKDYRFSLEWARIEPELGQFSYAALNHYRVELLVLKEMGIKPLLTFYHFSHPMWFEELGGFTKKENSIYFLEYVAEVLKVLGDLVDEYVTINEPNVYAVQSYFFGEWPPMKKSLKLTIDVMNNLAVCHHKAYEMIHRVLDKHKEVKVGYAHHVRVFEPLEKNNPVHIISTKLFEKAFQLELDKAFMLAEFNFPMKNIAKTKPGIYCDFIAINYYTRSAVGNFKDTYFEGPKNDLGWEIYPEGIIEVAKKSYELVAMPIYITENGTCDNQDSFRSKYIYDHLKEIMDSALPIERYYHWCFVDNFEWKEGNSARFGIVFNDYSTQTRTIKESGHFYSQMIKDNGVTDAAYEQCVAHQSYHYD